jgi:hypothetical protein
LIFLIMTDDILTTATAGTNTQLYISEQLWSGNQDKAMWVIVLSLLEIPSWFILLQCMINEQTFVLIISHTKLKIQITACKGYVVKDLLAHFTFAHLLCRYNFEIKILCIHVHLHLYIRSPIRTHMASFHKLCTSDSWKYLLLNHGDYTII